MDKLTRDRVIVLAWMFAFSVFLIAKDYTSAGILAVIGTVLVIKELLWPSDYRR